jgi:RHS repeat-associated protein
MKANACTLFRILVSACLLLVPISAHCFYNPSTGKWLSRDPIGEPSLQTTSGNRSHHIRGENLYTFVGNNPLKKFDFLGLTEKDVQTIINTFLSTMKTMCGDGRCCPEEGWRQNLYSWVSKREGCTQQAIDLYAAMYPLTKGRLEDNWYADTQQDTTIPPLFYHNYVTMTPLRPQPAGSDGYIVDRITVDTWKGCYTITRRKMVFIEPSPQQSFSLWKDETTCFKCKDLKAGSGN